LTDNDTSTNQTKTNKSKTAKSWRDLLDEEIDDNTVILTSEIENWDIPKNHNENSLIAADN
jgi:hypothetical protein